MDLCNRKGQEMINYTEKEVKEQGHFVFVDVNHVIECINECTRKIEENKK